MSLISVEALQTLIHDTIAQKPFHLRVESVPVAESVGRVLAEPIVSGLNIPSADISAMDGYALPSGAEAGATFSVIGESVAGKAFVGEVGPGQCVRIMTGAHVPLGCTTVVMQENVSREGDQIALTSDQAEGKNIRYRAEVVAQGQEVLEPGVTLSVAHVLLLASLGYAEVPVLRRLRVAVLSTGTELQEPGTEIRSDEMIFDSNRYMLMAKLRGLPVEVLDLGSACDDEQLILERLLEAAHRADVVLTSGGASVGDYDFVRDAVTRIGTIHHYKVAMKPGKPFVFGQIGEAWYFGLPGNPVSGFAGFEVFVRTALAEMAGSRHQSLRFKAALTHDLEKKAGRKEYQRAYIEQISPGNWTVRLVQGQDSHNVLGASKANAFAILPEADISLKAGDELLVQPFMDCFL